MLEAAIARLPEKQRETYRLIKEQQLKRTEAKHITGFRVFEICAKARIIGE